MTGDCLGRRHKHPENDLFCEWRQFAIIECFRGWVLCVICCTARAIGYSQNLDILPPGVIARKELPAVQGH